MTAITYHDLTPAKVTGGLTLPVWPLRIQAAPKAARWSFLSGGKSNPLLLFNQGFGEIQLYPQVQSSPAL